MKRYLTLLLVMLSIASRANSILIPMDDRQKNHLKSYGIAYFVLKAGLEVDWLLNYRGGSFMIKHSPTVRNRECRVRGISFEIISDADANTIQQQISNPDLNMASVKLGVGRPDCSLFANQGQPV